MAKFEKCPDCENITLLIVIKRDHWGDLVAFMKCVNCGYKKQVEVASKFDLPDEEEDEIE